MIAAIKNIFYTPPRHPYVCVSGEDAAGKTTLLYKIRDYEHTNYIRFSYETAKYGGAEFVAWDSMHYEAESTNKRIAAQYYFVKMHIDKADALVWVIDSTDRERWPESCANLEKLYKVKNSTTMPILILANKQDRPNSASTDEIRTSHNLNAYPNPWRIFRTQATSGENLYEAFQWLFAHLEDLGLKVTPPVERLVTADCELQH